MAVGTHAGADYFFLTPPSYPRLFPVGADGRAIGVLVSGLANIQAMRFPCTRCGCCCRRANLIPRDAQFPYKTHKGVCEMLAEDNTCKVYDHRPDVCRIDAHDTSERWYRMNAKMCNFMQEADKIDKSFRVKL